jgi:ABC-2 type transport system ATP-binding protein
LPCVVAAHIEHERLRLEATEVHVALPAVLAHVAHADAKLERLQTRHATLDDVFLKLTGSTFEEAEVAPVAQADAP